MALVPDKDFVCTASACKPLTEDARSRYVKLQKELSRFAGTKGFSPLTPDGIIGDLTAKAALAVMPDAFSLLAPPLFSTGVTDVLRVKQAMAQLAVDPDKFYAHALARGTGLPVPKPGVTAPAVPSSPLNPSVPPSNGGTPTWFWIAGGAGLVAIGVGTYYLLKD